MPTWPTQAECRRFYGAPGTNQSLLTLPYEMTHEGKVVKRITINRRCADSAFDAIRCCLIDTNSGSMGRLCDLPALNTGTFSWLDRGSLRQNAISGVFAVELWW